MKSREQKSEVEEAKSFDPSADESLQLLIKEFETEIEERLNHLTILLQPYNDAKPEIQETMNALIINGMFKLSSTKRNIEIDLAKLDACDVTDQKEIAKILYPTVQAIDLLFNRKSANPFATKFEQAYTICDNPLLTQTVTVYFDRLGVDLEKATSIATIVSKKFASFVTADGLSYQAVEPVAITACKEAALLPALKLYDVYHDIKLIVAKHINTIKKHCETHKDYLEIQDGLLTGLIQMSNLQTVMLPLLMLFKSSDVPSLREQLLSYLDQASEDLIPPFSKQFLASDILLTMPLITGNNQMFLACLTSQEILMQETVPSVLALHADNLIKKWSEQHNTEEGFSKLDFTAIKEKHIAMTANDIRDILCLIGAPRFHHTSDFVPIFQSSQPAATSTTTTSSFVGSEEKATRQSADPSTVPDNLSFLSSLKSKTSEITPSAPLLSQIDEKPKATPSVPLPSQNNVQTEVSQPAALPSRLLPRLVR